MNRNICWMLLVALGASAPLFGQDSAGSLLSAARKKAKLVRTLEGEAKKRAQEEVIVILRKVPEQFPKDEAAVARAWLEIGRAERRRGDDGKALAAYEKAIALKDQGRPVCDALHDLATLHFRLKRAKDGCECLERVVKDYRTQSRARSRALLRLASRAERRREYAAAEAFLRQCLDEHPDLWRNSVDALDRLARLKLKTGYRKEAVQLVSEVGDALRTRFSASSQAARVEAALAKMKIHAALGTDS